ncbi:MAG: AarF/UbiB family protein [Nocardioides sp.]|nr:AarF/UbiB family protein [Nocardioides sp.]
MLVPMHLSFGVTLSLVPWLLLFGLLARQLLGAKHLSVWGTLLASLVASSVALFSAEALIGEHESGALLLAEASSAAMFIVVTIMILDLAMDRSTRAGVNVIVAPSLPRPLRSMRRSFSNLTRIFLVSRIAAHHVGEASRVDHEGPGGHPLWPVALRKALDEAGGIFVKVGQVLSTRVDILPLWATAELSKLQQTALPEKEPAMRRMIEAELGRRVEEVFAEFEWSPVAAASLGQVHVARLVTGEHVAVKVQRPGIQEHVERDLAIVRRLARVAEARFDWASAFGVVAIADEIACGLRKELDYRTEADNAEAVAHSMRGMPEVHVHAVYREFSTSRVLTMELLEGTSVGTMAITSSQDGGTRQRLADALVRAELEPMLAGEAFHADPHPGNVFLLDDGRLGLLDFGAAGRLDTFERASIRSILGALQTGEPGRLREAIADVAEVDRDVDTFRLDHELARFMAEHLSAGTAPEAAAINKFLTIFAAYGIRLPPSTATMFRALVTLEGTLRTLVPDYRVLEAAQRVGVKAVSSELSTARLPQRAAQDFMELLPLLHDAPRHLDRLALLAERGGLRFQVSHTMDARETAFVGALVRLVVLALVGSALGGVAVALLAIEGGPDLTPTTSVLDALGYVSLAASGVILLRVLLSALRSSG